jgi:hypothetical protein
MILRSLGIPSTIDIVPSWGQKNGSHATEIFRDNEAQKFRTPSGRELLNPAKVIRYTYKLQNIWTDSILPFIGNEQFMLGHLKHNHWLDVTDEHTKTTNIEYQMSTNVPFAYICVYNYGNWMPVFWGKMRKEGYLRFMNMCTNMLYRIAIPEGKSYKIVSSIFQIDSMGNKHFFSPDFYRTEQMKLYKLNTGERSWVEKKKKYALYYADSESNWHYLETETCETDSVIFFSKVPSQTLYRLLKYGGENKLERPFTYKNGEQIWW